MAYVDRMTEVLVSDWRSALVAGDSNVHRINNVLEEDSEIECLPISGARYINDKKLFRNQLKMCMKKVNYQRLYLFLGSNDVLNSDRLFYRNVTEVCDLVHETSPETEIMLCEIPPRGPNQRKRIPGETLNAMRKWIVNANQALKDVSAVFPYVRFIGHNRFKVESHLTYDGLHLSMEGAELCHQAFVRDISVEEILSPVSSPSLEFIVEDWPVLGDIHTDKNSATDNCTYQTPYADIARASECISADCQAMESVDVEKPVMTRQKKIVNNHPKHHRRGRNEKRRFVQGRKRWLKKKFARKSDLRSVRNPVDYVVISLTDHVAVEIPAAITSGACSKRKESVKPSPTQPNKRSFVRTRLTRNQCDVRCSREDFLIDHVIRRHGSPKCTFSVPKSQRSACKLPESISDSSRTDDTSTTNTRVFTRNFNAQNMVCPSSSPVADDVNMSGLRLLLSNDVEQHPGPTVNCQWENCSEGFYTVGECDAHVVSHATRDKCCRWKGCPQYNIDSPLHKLETHVIRHVYDNEELFPSFEEWIATQPGGKFDQTRNLQCCPKHIRSKLQILFFDEDFDIPAHYYNTINHGEYLSFQFFHYPTRFLQDEKMFIAKRRLLGEDWSSYIGQDISGEPTVSTSDPRSLDSNEQAPTTFGEPTVSTSDHQSSDSNHRPNVISIEPTASTSDPQSLDSNLQSQRRFFSVPIKTKYDFVQTTRPELSSRYYSGSQLKPQKNLKRKHESITSLNCDQNNSPWFENLISNLSNCSRAISFQQEILDKIYDSGMVDPNNPLFFTIEQEAAKLSTIANCTAGTFICFVLKCIINEQDFFYIRYLESGCFSGYMHQKHMHILGQKYDFNDNNCFVHCVYTSEDLEEMKHVGDSKTVKRTRPDKIRKCAISNTLPLNVNKLQNLISETEGTSNVKLESYIVNIWPHKPATSVENPETPYLEVSQSLCLDHVKNSLIDFRINNLPLKRVASRDIFEKELPNNNPSLLQQSIFLNCLSSNIKREQSKNLFKRPGRYAANFIKNPLHTSSLRNHILVLYIAKDYTNLYSFLKSYFPALNDQVTEIPETSVSEEGPCAKKKKISNGVASVSINKSVLERKLKPDPTNIASTSETDPIPLFDSFCFQLLQHGKLSIQCIKSGDVMCTMNDYSETDGSFKDTEFVFTYNMSQEDGNYFFCSCRTFSTLLNINDSRSNNEFVVLGSAGENFVTCMHCKFLSQYVLPNIRSEITDGESPINNFIHKAVQDQGKELVELVRTNNTRKFSVFIAEEDKPTFVHVTFNSRIGKYIVACMNGQCLSKTGHKRNIETWDRVSVCKHLSVLRNSLDHWQDLKTNETLSTDISEDNNLNEIDNNVISESNTCEPISNFDEQTGLWNFKCRSSHQPTTKCSDALKFNLLKRDLWNDNSFKRDVDGCLIGPSLFPDMPDNTCDCGAGWLKREDDDNYHEIGRTIQESSRVLTIYTFVAPVKCQIHSRICYSNDNPCKITWDEGSLESLHVLSRETAAGDEIGWEFVSLVMNSGCTFSSYCKLKNESYQIRDTRAKFMDATVFLNWWFSWAANMKIDFRQPCDVCGFEPKRLCCDGTKVGVGFRHANFVEIENVHSEAPEHPTLHRRMNRCFLNNSDRNITVSQMVKNRQMLDYLAREKLDELKPQEILMPEERRNAIMLLKQCLPDQFSPSFDKFLPNDTPSEMHEDQQIAYAVVIKMLATTASVTSFLPPKYCQELQNLLEPTIDGPTLNRTMKNMRYYAPELRDLISESLSENDGNLEDYMSSFLMFLINESSQLPVYEADPPIPQPGSYNPAKYGRAYYFNELGLKLRNVRKFTMDKNKSKINDDHDDAAQDFEKCQKLFSKAHISARGTTSLFLWFCADHGHCYGFHMTFAEGRKDPSASLYSYLETPPTEVFYDYACGLQEYSLNRESGYYKNVRFFHDIFHSYSHKCSCAFRSSRLQGFESVNSEICEQFNSYLQNIKKSARQMTQEHFCFYLQFFLYQWNSRKRNVYQKKIKVALAGLN